MKLIVKLVLFVGSFFFLTGCETQTHDATIRFVPFIEAAPETRRKKPVDEIEKVYFSDWDMSRSHQIGINIPNEEAYIFTVNYKGEDIEKLPADMPHASEVLDLVESYGVQDWKRDYSVVDNDEYEDGYSWSFYIQFKDGTVHIHRGSGPDVEEMTPDQYTEFINDLFELVYDKPS